MNEMDSLMDRQTAMERLFEAMALALDKAGVLRLATLLPIAELLRIELGLSGDEGAAEVMRMVMGRLQAHSRAPDPLATVLLTCQLLRAAPENLRAAQMTWLGTASVEELADDIARSLLRPGDPSPLSSPPPPAVPGGKGSGGATS